MRFPPSREDISTKLGGSTANVLRLEPAMAKGWTATFADPATDLSHHHRAQRPPESPRAATQALCLVDGLIDGLEVYGGTIACTPFGRIGLIFTVPADSLRQAASSALDVATAAGHPEPLTVEVMPTREFRRRVQEGLEPATAGGRRP